MTAFQGHYNQPLADRVRPKNLSEVIGQEHLLSAGGLLANLIATKDITSLILWGPPGTGKTTLARILAKNTKNSDFIEISAVNSGLKEVKEILKRAQQNQNLKQKTVLFIDEIHRFNKAQQDALLPHVETGLIIVIGATTENPSFEVIDPLLSRLTVVKLEPLDISHIRKIIIRGVQALGNWQISETAVDLLAEMSGGDARVALSSLELASRIANTPKITKKHIKVAMQKSIISYDKHGEHHFNHISAFIKSLRGGDTDAALYYLFKMLSAGEDPKYIARRMIIFASEDVGMAAPYLLSLTVSVFDAVERVGLPEAEYALAHGAVALANATKNRDIANAIYAAKSAVSNYPNAEVPHHIRNAPTKLLRDFGYGKDYSWEAGFKPDGGFLPEALKGMVFYRNTYKKNDKKQDKPRA